MSAAARKPRLRADSRQIGRADGALRATIRFDVTARLCRDAKR